MALRNPFRRKPEGIQIRRTGQHSVVTGEQFEDPAAEVSRTRTASIIVFLVCIVLHVVLGVFTKFFDDHLAGWLLTLIERFIDALMVFAFAAGAATTSWFRTYLEDRLSRICERLIREDFTTRATDLDYLRQYDQEFLDKAEESMRRAAFAPHLPDEVEAFHAALNLARAQLDVWRTDYLESLFVYAVPDRPDLCRIVSTTTWTYVNYSLEPKTFRQEFSEVSYRWPRMKDDALYRVTKLSIGEVDRFAELTPTLEERNAGRQIAYRAGLEVTLPPMTKASEGIVLRMETEAIRARSSDIPLRFYRPVLRLRLQLRACEGMHPILHIFGLDPSGNENALIDPRKPELDRDNFYEWRYDGWFFPSQGVVLTLADMTQGAVAATAADAVGARPVIPPEVALLRLTGGEETPQPT